jgi:hypothetical protein
MLGFERTTCTKKINLDDNHNYNEYKTFLIQFLNTAVKALTVKGKIIIVVGDIEGKYCFNDL